jgi:hypothetical protein
LAVLAVQQIRRMRGGAQGQLMLGADGQVYVVKFQNNPQHRRVLANELMASRLAAVAGLAVPETDLVEVSSWLIENTPELEIDMGRTRERCQPGLHFGSRFAGGMMPGQVVDYLPEEQMAELKNLSEFAGILALDKWTGNANGRQAVFTRRQREKRYKAVFIDFGYPDLVACEIAFANDWADDLAIKTSSAVPADTWLPAPITPTVLANLAGLTVAAMNGSTVTVNTGVNPPSGGGFEIRLRDFAFMPGEDPKLVLRGSQPNLTFSRISASDRFYIRMYDGSTPPNYSEFSTALFINLPLSS